MDFLIVLFIILFRIAVLFIFGYTYYRSKPGRSKITVFLSFIGYWLSNSIIVLLYYIQRGLEKAYLSRMSSTSLEACLEEIQFGLIELFPFPIFPFFSKIVVLGILALILTVNILHFIYTFIYTGIFGILWVKYIRKIKEDESEVVHTDNSQMEDSSKVESPENSQNENTFEEVSTDTIEDSLSNNLPPVNIKEKLYSILRELFKK